MALVEASNFKPKRSIAWWIKDCVELRKPKLIFQLS